MYGDHPGLPKVEAEIGTPLSPYAVSKRTDELYARTFQDHYGLEVIGLRYFNVFGRRQDPSGAYAAVIPKWIGQLLDGDRPAIFGDGETSRDFCYIANVVQANLRAGVAPADATGTVYNIAYGDRTTLNELYAAIVQNIEAERPGSELARRRLRPLPLRRRPALPGRHRPGPRAPRLRPDARRRRRAPRGYRVVPRHVRPRAVGGLI